MRTILLALLLTVPHCAEDFSYVYMRHDGGSTISRGDLDEVLRIRERVGGTFLWARIDGREYVVRDASVLEEFDEAFAPLRALEREQENLRSRMRRVEDREERLESEADLLRDSEEELSSVERTRLRELERSLGELRVELRPLENEERRLDEREEALERAFDAEVERIVRRAVRDGSAKRHH